MQCKLLQSCNLYVYNVIFILNGSESPLFSVSSNSQKVLNYYLFFFFRLEHWNNGSVLLTITLPVHSIIYLWLWMARMEMDATQKFWLIDFFNN